MHISKQSSTWIAQGAGSIKVHWTSLDPGRHWRWISPISTRQHWPLNNRTEQRPRSILIVRFEIPLSWLRGGRGEEWDRNWTLNHWKWCFYGRNRRPLLELGVGWSGGGGRMSLTTGMHQMKYGFRGTKKKVSYSPVFGPPSPPLSHLLTFHGYNMTFSLVSSETEIADPAQRPLSFPPRLYLFRCSARALAQKAKEGTDSGADRVGNWQTRSTGGEERKGSKERRKEEDVKRTRGAIETKREEWAERWRVGGEKGRKLRSRDWG